MLVISIILLILLELFLGVFSTYSTFLTLSKEVNIKIKLSLSCLLWLSIQPVLFIPFELLDSSQRIPFNFVATQDFSLYAALILYFLLFPVLNSVFSKDFSIAPCKVITLSLLTSIVYCLLFFVACIIIHFTTSPVSVDIDLEEYPNIKETLSNQYTGTLLSFDFESSILFLIIAISLLPSIVFLPAGLFYLPFSFISEFASRPKRITKMTQQSAKDDLITELKTLCNEKNFLENKMHVFYEKEYNFIVKNVHKSGMVNQINELYQSISFTWVIIKNISNLKKVLTNLKKKKTY